MPIGGPYSCSSLPRALSETRLLQRMMLSQPRQPSTPSTLSVAANRHTTYLVPAAARGWGPEKGRWHTEFYSPMPDGGQCSCSALLGGRALAGEDATKALYWPSRALQPSTPPTSAKATSDDHECKWHAGFCAQMPVAGNAPEAKLRSRAHEDAAETLKWPYRSPRTGAQLTQVEVRAGDENYKLLATRTTNCMQDLDIEFCLPDAPNKSMSSFGAQLRTSMRSL